MPDEKISKKERRLLKKQEKVEKQAREAQKKQRGKYIGWGIGIAVLIGLGFFLKTAFTPPPAGSIPELQSTIESDSIKGASDSATLLVEYSDFQCPACRQYYPVVDQLIEEKGDQFAFVYRHFPLAQHPNADDAAWASEAAGKQGKFWEMHDLLFDRQDAWAESNNPQETFTSYAAELDLDTEQFIADYASDDVKNKVSTDYNSGVKFGVNATPTFYLNGQKIRPGSLDDFKQLIDEANASE